MVMIFNPFIEQRRLHKLRLLDLLKKNPQMDKEQLIALFSLQTGLKTTTIREYLRELEESGISLENGRVHTEVRDEGAKQNDKQPNDRAAGSDQHSEAARE